MTKTRSTKRALLGSALALLICVSMLIGTTFAWFTDSVTSAGNKIQAGTLNIDMLVMDESGVYQSVKESKAPIFTDDVLWEPGYTEWRNVKVSTTGNLALKYQMNIAMVGESSALADVIDVYYAASEIAKPATRSLDGLTRLGTLSEIFGSNAAGALIQDTLIPGNNSEDFATIVLKMQESAGNQYQGLSIGAFDINIAATQLTYENDSFDNQYDKDADYDGEISNATTLAAAFTNGGTYKVMNDIDAGDETFVAADGTVLNLDGNELSAKSFTSVGNTYIANGTLTMSEEGRVYASEGNANITLEDVVIDSDSLSVLAKAGGTVTLKDVTIINTTTSNPVQNYGGNLILDNVTVAQEGDAASAWYSSALQVINQIVQDSETGKWQVISQANTTIENGNYTGKKAIMISAPGGNVTINGGTFVGSEAVIQADFAPNNYLDGSNYESVITINGGSFTGNIKVSKAAVLVIKGGTFSVDPSAYLAEGYVATKNADGTYTVVKGVSNAAELAKAIKDGGKVVLAGDINLTQKLEVKKDVVIDLNGYTITAPSSGNMFLSQSNAAPSMIITSSVPGAVIDATNSTLTNVVQCYGKTEIRNVTINAGGNSVLLGYGSTEFYNVEINVGEIKSSSYTTFKVYGDLTLGEGTVVNVDYLGTSLISNNAKKAIVIDGAQINVGTFKVNGGYMISLTGGTTLALNDTEITVGLDTTYASYFISKAENATIGEDCTFNVTDTNGASYNVEEKNGKYGFVKN